MKSVLTTALFGICMMVALLISGFSEAGTVTPGFNKEIKFRTVCKHPCLCSNGQFKNVKVGGFKSCAEASQDEKDAAVEECAAWCEDQGSSVSGAVETQGEL